MQQDKYALTGASGFIGQNLINKIGKDHVVVISRQLLHDPYALRRFFIRENPQVIIHTAAYGNHSTQQDDPETFYTNVINTWNLLQASKEIDYKAFINFGSSSEYGKKPTAMREEDMIEPLTMYACTKAAGTMLARAHAKKYNKPIVTVRPFSVYGIGEAEHRFIPTVIRAMLQGTEITIEPDARHDWIYIDDFIEGVQKVIENATALSGQAINIGTGKQYSNNDIVAGLSYISGKTIKTTRTVGLRPLDSNNWVANINTMKILGWKPKTTLLDGLILTYQYYQKLYESN